MSKNYNFNTGEIHQFLLDSGYVTIHGATTILDYCYKAKKEYPNSNIHLTTSNEADPLGVIIDVWNFREEDLLDTKTYFFEDINY